MESKDQLILVHKNKNSPADFFLTFIFHELSEEPSFISSVTILSVVFSVLARADFYFHFPYILFSKHALCLAI